MVDLVLHQLRRIDPALVPGEARGLDAVRQANVPLEYKKNILAFVWQNAGPAAVLSIGQGIDEVEYDPVWQAAVRSASPSILLDKWSRFEVFAHSTNRLRFDHLSDNCVSFQRYTVDGGVPGYAENFLICGLIIALLESIGCHELCCRMSDSTSGQTAHQIYHAGKISLPADLEQLATDNWVIDWQDFVSPYQSDVKATRGLSSILPKSVSGIHKSMLEKLARLLMVDVSRPWKVEDLAHEAGMSKRSLQRKLKDSGLSFSQLVRLVRVHESCRLLAQDVTPITAIGFCTGFSDSAHFSRDFRASMGMTPTDYRALSC